MATRLLNRSKTLNLTLNRGILQQPPQSFRSLHSLTSPLGLGAYRTSDPRSAPSRSVPRPDLAVGGLSPTVSSILGSTKIFDSEKTLLRWFSVNAQGRPTSYHDHFADKKETGTMITGSESKQIFEPVDNVSGKEVTCFSPLEASALKTRSSSLGTESLKINRTELSQKISFALIPALVLLSKSSLTTSLLVLSVYWQIYGYFKEIFLDYVHQEVTRKWVLVYFKVFLLILIKDTFLDFGLI